MEKLLQNGPESDNLKVNSSGYISAMFTAQTAATKSGFYSSRAGDKKYSHVEDNGA